MLFPELVEVLDPEPHAAALNMGIDEALLQDAPQPTLRVYGWREPAVSFGYFDRIAEVERLAAGRGMVRRWTGGGIVEHGDDLTYTLVVPRGHPFLLRAALESYRLIHEAIGQWLAGAGIDGVAMQTAASSGAEISSACFANPVRYDVLAAGAKIAGAAQRRTRWGLLHQGSVRTGGTVAEDVEKLAGYLGERVTREGLRPELEAEARGLVERKYGTVEWMRKY